VQSLFTAQLALHTPFTQYVFVGGGEQLAVQLVHVQLLLHEFWHEPFTVVESFTLSLSYSTSFVVLQ
jgi:hypothetical protein